MVAGVTKIAIKVGDEDDVTRRVRMDDVLPSQYELAARGDRPYASTSSSSGAGGGGYRQASSTSFDSSRKHQQSSQLSSSSSSHEKYAGATAAVSSRSSSQDRQYQQQRQHHQSHQQQHHQQRYRVEGRMKSNQGMMGNPAAVASGGVHVNVHADAMAKARMSPASLADQVEVSYGRKYHRKFSLGIDEGNAYGSSSHEVRGSSPRPPSKSPVAQYSNDRQMKSPSWSDEYYERPSSSLSSASYSSAHGGGHGRNGVARAAGGGSQSPMPTSYLSPLPDSGRESLPPPSAPRAPPPPSGDTPPAYRMIPTANGSARRGIGSTARQQQAVGTSPALLLSPENNRHIAQGTSPSVTFSLESPSANGTRNGETNGHSPYSYGNSPGYGYSNGTGSNGYGYNDDVAEQDREFRRKYGTKRNAEFVSELKNRVDNYERMPSRNGHYQIDKEWLERRPYSPRRRYEPEFYMKAIPVYDDDGHPIPEWRRQFIARQLATHARRIMEENPNIREDDDMYFKIKINEMLEDPEWKKKLGLARPTHYVDPNRAASPDYRGPQARELSNRYDY